MSKNHPTQPESTRQPFAFQLLQQDMALHSKQYQEHRMQLEQQLIQAETRKKLAKRVVLGAILLAVVTIPILGSNNFGSPDPYNRDASVVSVAAGALYFVAVSTIFLGLASYYTRFVPKVRQAREDLRDESIRVLLREVADLRRLVVGKTQSESGTLAKEDSDLVSNETR